HRLSAIQHANLILVVDEGRIVQRGTYVVKATAKTELTELETEKEVDLADEQSEKVKVDLSLEGKYVSISSDESDATVFVNGKKRGKLNYGSYKLGPVPTDETVEVHLEKTTDLGVMKSESVKIGDQSTYYLKFPKETSSSAVGEFVRNHLMKLHVRYHKYDFL
ncbi:TcaA 3rd/4th domain-containing protein, partial [Bacillus sp. SS-TM]